MSMHLFARAEQHLNRPSPGELRDHPRQTRLQVRREQVAIPHPPRRVTHHHHLDRHASPTPSATPPRRPTPAATARSHRPTPSTSCHTQSPVVVRLRSALAAASFGLGQPRPLLRLAAALALLGRRHARVVHGRVAAQPPHEGHPLVQVRPATPWWRKPRRRRG